MSSRPPPTCELPPPSSSVIVDEQTFRRTRDAIEYRGAAGTAATGSEPASERVGGDATAGAAWRRPLAAPRTVRRPRTRARRRCASGSRGPSPNFAAARHDSGCPRDRQDAPRRGAAAGRDRRGEPVTWRQGRSLPYGEGVSFWALGEMVKAEAGILESDPSTRWSASLQGGGADRRGSSSRRNGSRRPWALSSVSAATSAATRRAAGEAFSRWRNFLEALAHERPLVLVFEDLHWADEGLLDFVDELLDRASGVRLLVLATARPELLERRPRWAGGKPNALTMSLPPLSESDTARLVAGTARAAGAGRRGRRGAACPRRRQPAVRGAVLSE